MKSKPIKQIFMDYLDEHGVKREFYDAWMADNPAPIHTPDKYFSQAFRWPETKNESLWVHLHTLWVDKLEKMKDD